MSHRCTSQGKAYNLLSCGLVRSDDLSLEIDGWPKNVFDDAECLNVISFLQFCPDNSDQSLRSAGLVERELPFNAASYEPWLTFPDGAEKNLLLKLAVSLYNESTYDLLDFWDAQIAELASGII